MAGLLTAADVASMRIAAATALDTSLPLSRKTTANDGAGHTTETWASIGTISCNVRKATAPVLQTYASIIADRRSAVLRILDTADVREGDRVVYDGLNWAVQAVMDAGSYTVTTDYLMTVIV